MDYEKKYKETLERAKEIKSKILYSHLSTESCKAVSEYIDTIIPELTESEDERIRKEIINFLVDMRCKGEWIAYLEKQKPAEKSSMLKKLKEHLANTPREQLDAEFEALKDFTIDKPVEWSEEDETRLKVIKEELERYIMFNQYGTPLAVDDIAWLESLPERFNLQPKQEWSEEDSDNLERVDNYLWMLDNYVGDDCAMPQGKTDKIRGNIQEVLSPWLKSLPERFNLQSKQEWSEEDESNLQWIISCVKGTNVYTSQELAKELTEWLKNKLKSLRPQPHTVSIKNANKFAELEYERGVKDGIQSEKSHHWKPSKEQMEALFTASERNDKLGSILNSLYYDLKKL